ncbi:MAG: alpha/beta hydrolase [Desulfovibrionaceae bacterium]
MPDTACLLIHGFTSSPFEMEPIARALAGAGVRVHSVLLPGHGTTLADLDATTFADWVAAAEAAFLDLRRAVARVSVVGMSLGGSIGLALAERHDPAALMTIATPVYLYRLFPWEGTDRRLPLVRFLRHVRPLWPARRHTPEELAIAPFQGYEGVTPLNALWSFIQGLKAVRRDLPRITCPLLAVHCPTDATTPPGNAQAILDGVSSMEKRVEYPRITETVTNHHKLTTHRETRDQIAAWAVELVMGGAQGVGEGETG